MQQIVSDQYVQLLLWHDAVTGCFELLITNFDRDRVQTTTATCETILIHSATLTVPPFFGILQLL